LLTVHCELLKLNLAVDGCTCIVDATGNSTMINSELISSAEAND